METQTQGVLRNTPADRIIPLSKWNDYHDWPTVGALRWHYSQREQNGLASARAVVRAGGRLLVDEAAFFGWVRSRPTVP